MEDRAGLQEFAGGHSELHISLRKNDVVRVLCVTGSTD